MPLVRTDWLAWRGLGGRRLVGTRPRVHAKARSREAPMKEVQSWATASIRQARQNDAKVLDGGLNNSIAAMETKEDVRAPAGGLWARVLFFVIPHQPVPPRSMELRIHSNIPLPGSSIPFKQIHPSRRKICPFLPAHHRNIPGTGNPDPEQVA